MNQSKYMQGVALLEGLFAILIFSMGVLAMLGMHVNAINSVSEAKFRSDAAFLADQLIGELWIANPANLGNYAYSGSGSPNNAVKPWVDQVKATLPGASGFPPIVTVVTSTLFTNLAGNPVNQYTVTVTIRYRPPKITNTRQHVATAVISGN